MLRNLRRKELGFTPNSGFCIFSFLLLFFFNKMPHEVLDLTVLPPKMQEGINTGLIMLLSGDLHAHCLGIISFRVKHRTKNVKFAIWNL